MLRQISTRTRQADRDILPRFAVQLNPNRGLLGTSLLLRSDDSCPIAIRGQNQHLSRAQATVENIQRCRRIGIHQITGKFKPRRVSNRLILKFNLYCFGWFINLILQCRNIQATGCFSTIKINKRIRRIIKRIINRQRC